MPEHDVYIDSVREIRVPGKGSADLIEEGDDIKVVIRVTYGRAIHDPFVLNEVSVEQARPIVLALLQEDTTA